MQVISLVFLKKRHAYPWKNYRSGMVEDLGPAASRYQLAVLLNVQERTLPTECVHYSFPCNLWTPVKMEDGTGGFASLKVDGDNKYKLLRDGVETDVTAYICRVNNDNNTQGGDVTNQDGNADVGGEGSRFFLGGRVTVMIRPLCIIDRPGCLLQIPQSTRCSNSGDGNDIAASLFIMGVLQVQFQSFCFVMYILLNCFFVLVLQRYDEARAMYVTLLSDGQNIQMTPYEVEDAIVKTDTKLKVSIAALQQISADATILLTASDGLSTNVEEALEIDAKAFFICTLDSQGSEEVEDGKILVRVPRTSVNHGTGFEHSACLFGATQINRLQTEYINMKAELLQVDIQYVQGLFTATADFSPSSVTSQQQHSAAGVGSGFLGFVSIEIIRMHQQ